MRAEGISGNTIMSLILMCVLGGCSIQKVSSTDSAGTVNENEFGGVERAGTMPVDSSDMSEVRGIGPSVPRDLETIPSAYFNPASQQGTLVELVYTTYESKSYRQKSKEITKRAIVYLPYGYDKRNRYNIFYLMYGGWSNETTSLGSPDQPNSFKNVIDQSIQNGKMKPLVIVCPAYNNQSKNDSADYELAFYTLTVNYHNELVNGLIPAVEGTYSTWAKSTASADIEASRDHRAFG